MHAPGGGSGGPGQRAFFVGYVPAAPGGPAAHQGVGLHLQERCFRLAKEKPQVRGLVLRPWASGRGATRKSACWQRGDTRNGRRQTSINSLFPLSRSTAASRRRPVIRSWPSWGDVPRGGAVCKTVPARLGRVGERGGKHYPGLLDKVSRGGRAGKE